MGLYAAQFLRARRAARRPDGLKRLVNACHAQGIAVILDAVYAHAHPEFAYNLVYDTSGEPNPMMGFFAGEFFTPSRHRLQQGSSRATTFPS